MQSVIGALRVNLGIDTAAFNNGLRQAQGSLAKYGAALKTGALAVAAAGAAAVGGLAAGVNSAIDAADDMSKAASKIGIPTEELSRLKYAADLSGVSFEGLQTSVGRLSRNMQDAAKGVGQGAEAFAALGISVTNADGSLRSSSDVMREMADRFAAMPDGAEKTALAMQLMGRSGADMIPLLNGGADALGKLMAEADTFGQVFSAEMGQQAEVFNDNLSRLRGAFAALSADVAEKLLPTLVKFTNWLVENGPQISAFVVKGVEDFARLGAEVGAAINQIVTVLQTVDARFQAAMAAIDRFHQSVTTGMQQAAAAVRNGVLEMEAALVGLRDRFLQAGHDLIDGLVEGIRGSLSNAASAVRDAARLIIQSAQGALGIQSPSTVFAEIGRNIMQGLSGGIASMQGDVQGEVQGFAQSIASTFTDILSGATSFREGMRGILEDVGSSFLQSGLSGLGGLLGLPAFANGTRFAPGGLAWVGERGPELVNLPRGSQVIPNRDLQGVGGQVDVRVFMDRDGNWQGAVEKIAGDVSAKFVAHGMAQVRRDVPRIAADAQRRAG